MKSKRRFVAGGLVLGLVTLGCVLEAQTPPPRVMWQNMPIVALQNGHFQESVTIGEAKAHGDLGIGAMAQLDGEVVSVGGVIYQFGSDGVVRVPPDSARMSFAAMARFRPSSRPAALPAGTIFKNLGSVVDPGLPSLNTFYAIRIQGTFSSVLSRTYPRQQEPFPPLCKVEQTKFPPFTNVKGTIVGFRSPQYLSNLALPGYHLHFLTDDKKGGGHVLDFTVASATIEVDRTDSLALDFPTDRAFATMDLSSAVTCPPAL